MTEILPSSVEEPSSEERRRLYNKAVREAELVNILLGAVDFKVNRQVPPPKRGSESGLSYGGKMIEFAYLRGEGTCATRIEWKVQFKSGKRNYATCRAQYDAIYEGFSDTHESVIRHFAANVAQGATYAYFRALFASLDWASELRLPPLPIIKFHPKV